MFNEILFRLLILIRDNQLKIVKSLHYFMLVAFPVWTGYHLYQFYNGEEVYFLFVFFFFLNLYLIIKNSKQLKKLR